MNKKILELIEPYMNKTLSEGCFIKAFDNCKSIFGYIIEDLGNPYLIQSQRGQFELCKEDFDILGHYDITAVSIFIRKKTDYRIEVSIHGVNLLIFKQNEKNETTHLEAIPNKPLNLYEKKEEKALLKLLLKLK